MSGARVSRRSRPFVALFGVTVLAALAGSPARLAGQTGALAGLDDYVTAAMEAWGIPGLALAVVRNDSVIYAKGYGVREVGKPGAVDTRTLFNIASTSKAFTAAALGRPCNEAPPGLRPPGPVRDPGGAHP